MIVERSSHFARWTQRLIDGANAGDPYAVKVAGYVYDQLLHLKALPDEPNEESAVLKRVRQSRKHQLWRLSHAYDPDCAVRVICWFDRAARTAVVAVLGADKAPMGDTFYDSVGSRADQIIDDYLRGKAGEQGD